MPPSDPRLLVEPARGESCTQAGLPEALTKTVAHDINSSLDYDKCQSAPGRSSTRLPAVSTLRERLLWVVAERGENNQRRLSLKCGLKETHIGALLSRLKKKPDSGVEVETLQRISAGAKVSFAWLAQGIGTPDDWSVDYDKFHVKHDATYANLAKVLRENPGLWPDPVVQDAKAFRGAMGDQEPYEWTKLLSGMARVHAGKSVVKPSSRCCRAAYRSP